MPRKIRIPEDPARNRENQQRCRARRREHIRELERRVREYERRDAEASYGMQRAAQAVAWKNERLLALLALHGVSRGEIDAFLQPPGSVGAAATARNAAPSADGFTPLAASSAGAVGVTSGGGAKLDCLRVSSNAKAGSPGHIPLARACSATSRCVTQKADEPCSADDDGDAKQDDLGVPSNMTAGSLAPRPLGRACSATSRCVTRNSDEPCSAGSQSSYETTETNILSRQLDSTSSDTGADNLDSPATEIGLSNGSPAQVTSCDAAAAIIADLQGHGDAARARGLLDCGDSRNCHVKNTRLFQLMVETP
ncbi:hypothetical protein DL766_000456 [Monosporascus sp. MC13-8B]|uniref:BZIP domain-containing protein n=1 Tax=Monosporascus cannonballus TaxID=155416 RepID=A0ABY0H5H8_9PEZI|nr:hypothetical protein DL762_005221 [Monosporascus cannonballus]RYP00197.1 hypothetical protein DL763_000966 [Monosporascus cannonballus]RYP39304.1 hypothetical protein DL766_000456 [Monosporascus sp. MC13-8B]